MQFDVYRNLGRGSIAAPFFVDLQHEQIENLRTTIVAPLVAQAQFKAHPRMTPEISVLGSPYILSIAEMFAIERRLLGPPIQNIAALRHRIVAALDFLFTGV